MAVEDVWKKGDTKCDENMIQNMKLAQDLMISLHLCLTSSFLHPFPLELDHHKEYTIQCLILRYLRYIYSGASILTKCFCLAQYHCRSLGHVTLLINIVNQEGVTCQISHIGIVS